MRITEFMENYSIPRPDGGGEGDTCYDFKKVAENRILSASKVSRKSEILHQCRLSNT